MNRKTKFRLGNSFTFEEKRKIRQDHIRGYSFPRIAKEYDTKPSVIARICNG